MSNWKLYSNPVYWTLPDDGADIKCAECGIRENCNKMILLQTPNGKRTVIHRKCVDEDFFTSFKVDYLGEFKL